MSGKKSEGKKIYRLNDTFSFRKCSLYEAPQISFGNCTNFEDKEIDWVKHYCCKQEGIHFHCTKHPEIEMNRNVDDEGRVSYECPRCGGIEHIVDSESALRSECLRMLNIPEFKGARLIRLDDYYVHEITKKEKTESGYWITADIKTDKDGDTMIVLYVGNKDFDDKAQFFIKPEKGQLTSDHNDMDPVKVLSKIEVQFKDRRLTQEYNDAEDDVSE